MSRWLKRGVGLLFALLGFFFIGANAWVWSAGWGRLAKEASEIPAGSVMVLLGTDEFVGTTGERSGTFGPRIDAAVELARSGRVRLVVTSGTDVHARVMAEKLRAAGVTCPIVEDPYGWRTLDSVLRAKAYYPDDDIVFVSQGWHCVRALWQADRIITATDRRIQVTNGLFSIQFGDTGQGDPALSPSIFSTANLRYLEVELPSTATNNCATNGCASFTEGPFTPRQPLASSPYAFNADALDGITTALAGLPRRRGGPFAGAVGAGQERW